MINLEKIEDYNYEGQRLLFEHSNRIDENRYTILLIDEYDDDYLNLAINIKAKNKNEFDKDYQKIKEIMNKEGKKASVLITNKELIKMVDFKAKNLEVTDNSAWLILEDLKKISFNSKDKDISIIKVNQNQKDEYIKAVCEGFKNTSEEDPYDGLSDSVVEAIRRSFTLSKKFKTEHYMAYINHQIVGTITMMYKEDIAYIYNVTTNKNYRKKGICKQMISHVIRRLKSLNIDQAILQTEVGFYPEVVYKKLGFREIFKGVKYTEKE